MWDLQCRFEHRIGNRRGESFDRGNLIVVGVGDDFFDTVRINSLDRIAVMPVGLRMEFIRDIAEIDHQINLFAFE